MDGEETKVADDIGRYAVKAVQSMMNARVYDSGNSRQEIESLSAMLWEEKGHHVRREGELRNKIRELRAEAHYWKELYTQLLLK